MLSTLSCFFHIAYRYIDILYYISATLATVESLLKFWCLPLRRSAVRYSISIIGKVGSFRNAYIRFSFMLPCSASSYAFDIRIRIFPYTSYEYLIYNQAPTSMFHAGVCSGWLVWTVTWRSVVVRWRGSGDYGCERHV